MSQQHSISYISSQEEHLDLEAILASIDAVALAPIEAPTIKSGIPAILAEIAAIRARAANDDRPATLAPSSPPRKKSKSTGVRPRRSQARDYRNLPRLPGFSSDVREEMRRRSTGGMIVLVSVPPSSSKTPSKTKNTITTKEKTKRQKADENDTRAAPAWRYTTEILRGACFIRSVSARGAGLSFSLNLDGKALQAANDNPKRFMGHFQDRLAKALKAEFGEVRDFMFSPELSLSGRIHFHGAVDATDDERDRVEAILARLGGLYTPAAHVGRQAHTDVLWGPDGWLRYTLKAMAATKLALGLKTILYVTRGCRARAEALWEASR